MRIDDNVSVGGSEFRHQPRKHQFIMSNTITIVEYRAAFGRLPTAENHHLVTVDVANVRLEVNADDSQANEYYVRLKGEQHSNRVTYNTYLTLRNLIVLGKDVQFFPCGE